MDADYVQHVMLENRDYMRQESFEPRRLVTVALLIALVIAFVLQNVAQYYFSSLRIDRYFALSVAGLRQGYVWQLITFQFMHGGWLHLLLNCWAIYVFGRAIEETLGRKKFLFLYFSSGVVGGLFQIVGAILLPTHLGGAVVGASAGAFGLVAAFAMLYPERPLTMLLFFILPLTMRAKYLLVFCALIALFGIAFPGDGIAHAAHLGGMLMGIVYVRHIIHWQWCWADLGRTLRRTSPRELVNVHTAKWHARGQSDEQSPEEFLAHEVDPILDKISAHGIQSLTDRERQILEAARKKMERR